MKKILQKQIFLFFCFFIIIFISSPLILRADERNDEYEVVGPLKKYHSISINFKGPYFNSDDNSPNPFLDYRLQVIFKSPGGDRYNVPGFFNGDGKGENSGNIWTVRFTPLEQGKYSFKAQFQKGSDLAIQALTEEGESVYFDGTSGNFRIKKEGNNALGFHKKGMLKCSERHYFQFTNGEYWLKGGTDSPEDFLAYKGFSNTPNATHEFSSHVKDWRKGDPDWNNGAGKGIIGALNYLAEQHVNSIYFLVMNIGGDGKNVWPFISDVIDREGAESNDNLHYDIKKLEEWEKVFIHAQNRGIFLHFVLNEAEKGNKLELDNGELGIERKLYYREIVARFSHHLGLQWNLCEEYNLGLKLSPQIIKSYAGYIRSIDPYNHPVSVHHAGDAMDAWRPFLGDDRFCVTSIQTNNMEVVEKLRDQSADAGNPLVIGMDEFFPDKSNSNNANRHRKEYLWPVYFSGGQIEFILEELVKTEDFRKHEDLWNYMWYARKFLTEYLPFEEMSPADSMLTEEGLFEGKYGTYEGQVLIKAQALYAVYLPVSDKTGKLNPGTDGQYSQRWYNPRSGKFEGKIKNVKFSGNQSFFIGPPPSNPSQDWVVLFKKIN